MKILFDSSVLVPVFYGDHPHHRPSAQVFLSVVEGDGCCALPTLGEVYVVLSGLPVRPRITGREAMSAVRQIRERLAVTSLDEAEYVSVLESLSETGIVGAASYDALIANCALKADAAVILTWNVRDFARFGPDISRRVKTPLDL